MSVGEPCDICAKGLERPPGAVGTLRCRDCHTNQLNMVEVECSKRGWSPQQVVSRGREVIQALTPVGLVTLVDMDDVHFLLADVERELADVA